MTVPAADKRLDDEHADMGRAGSFREEVRRFLLDNLSPGLAARSRAGYYLSKDELMGWHRALARRGWIGANWPVQYGGPGWTPQQRYEFEDECAKAGAPILIAVGINQVASLLIKCGTGEQKARHLPAIRAGDAIWCQGFSEPQAGSDLASLRCKAERVGDEYVINGSKIWTTAAHWSDWCFLLVRTDSSGRKQEGITILLLDMKTPGVTIRPIIGIDGMHSLNETFLDNVRIPVSNRVGRSAWRRKTNCRLRLRHPKRLRRRRKAPWRHPRPYGSRSGLTSKSQSTNRPPLRPPPTCRNPSLPNPQCCRSPRT